MPYLLEQTRKRLDRGRFPERPGELNYVLTQVILKYLKDISLYKNTNTYTDYNDVLGVLEAVKQEFYRRVVVPYEEKKKRDNGDVF